MITELNMWDPKPYMFLYDWSWKTRGDSNSPARKQQQDGIASKPNLMNRRIPWGDSRVVTPLMGPNPSHFSILHTQVPPQSCAMGNRKEWQVVSCMRSGAPPSPLSTKGFQQTHQHYLCIYLSSDFIATTHGSGHAKSRGNSPTSCLLWKTEWKTELVWPSVVWLLEEA